MKTFKEFIKEAYGDKRDHKKINIFVNGTYHSSTSWAATHKEAKQKFLEKYPEHKEKKIQTQFDEESIDEAPYVHVQASDSKGKVLADKIVHVKDGDKNVKSYMSRETNRLTKKFGGSDLKTTKINVMTPTNANEGLDEASAEPRHLSFENGVVRPIDPNNSWGDIHKEVSARAKNTNQEIKVLDKNLKVIAHYDREGKKKK